MRIPVWLTMITALAALALVLVVGSLVIAPPQPLIVEAGFSPTRITPNADGSDDITVFSYALSRGAFITVTFESEDGRIFVFRDGEERAAGSYRVEFSGVVDGYVLPGEQIAGDVLRRLMPDGAYTWRLLAVNRETGEQDERSGELLIEDGDPLLPELVEFTVYPDIFTPNQDGIADRTAINVFLTKDADLQVYLQREGMEPIFIPQRMEDVEPGRAGRYTYDYEGGVDLGADPPPDGEYTVVAVAQDAVGQRVQRTATLTIRDGGKPLAQIIPQPTGATVVFEARPFEERFTTTRDQRGDLIDPPVDPASLNLNMITMPVGDMLVFKLTVENYSEVPIRTAGSPPGTVFHWEQRAATLGEFDQSGAWRVGIDCDTAASDYPWRWAIGDASTLVEQIDPNTGDVHYYLPAGARSIVWGAVRMTAIEARNPQNCWAGLIHEDVEIALRNRNVGPRRILLVDLDSAEIGPSVPSAHEGR